MGGMVEGNLLKLQLFDIPECGCESHHTILFDLIPINVAGLE